LRAVVARELGPPETFSIEDIETPPVRAGEVRVAVHAAGVSFVDVLNAAGGYQLKPPVPFIPGSEFSGTIVEVGEGVAHVAVGDKVCGGGLGGPFAEELVVTADRVQRLPDGADMDEAAVVRGSFLTALYGLVNQAHIAAGETEMVLGAGGAVGVAACQLGRHFGATVIASASSEAKRALALANGAAHAIDSAAADWRDQVKALTGGRGLDIVVDTIGGTQTERAFRSLAWKGRHLVIGYASGTIPALPVNLALLKGASLIGVDARQFGVFEPDALQQGRDEVMRLFATGAIRPPIDRVYPMEQFVEAMQRVSSGDSAGRILLRIAPGA
jgi:NADPH2:quinone reductase